MSERVAGEGRQREQKDISDLVQDVTEFFSKLDGIDYFVLVNEGFPLAYTGISQDRAESAAALAVDLATATEIYIADLINDEINSVVVFVQSGKTITVARSKGLLLLVEGQRRITEEAAQIASGYLEGRRVHCFYCRHDLTLETYKCPSCGRTIPFRSDVCPFCSRMIPYKGCPSCGRLVTSTGGKAEIAVAAAGDALKLALVEGFIGGIILGSLGFIATMNPVVALAAGAMGAAVTGFFVYRNATRRG